MLLHSFETFLQYQKRSSTFPFLLRDEIHLRLRKLRFANVSCDKMHFLGCNCRSQKKSERDCVVAFHQICTKEPKNAVLLPDVSLNSANVDFKKRNTHTHTHTHTHTPTHPHTHPHTFRERERVTHTHTYIKTHRYTGIEREIHTQRHTDILKHTQTQTNTDDLTREREREKATYTDTQEAETHLCTWGLWDGRVREEIARFSSELHWQTTTCALIDES